MVMTTCAASPPRVTVFVPVYNGEPFLAETIESVLTQTYRDFELLVVDDCSTDRSAEIVLSYSDSRIRLDRNELNRGRPYTRNRGLQLARGEYFAVLDADDVCEPQRLEKSVAFLDAQPDIAAVGSAATYIDDSGRALFVQRVPSSSDAIRRRIFTANCFVHSSVTFRRAAVLAIGGYDERLPYSQDYDLFLRLAADHRLANLTVPLVRYRVHGGQVSQKKMAAQRRLADGARSKAFYAQMARGAIDPAVQPPDVGLLSGLLGRSGTLAADRLDWARINLMLGNRAASAGLVARAIARAPLCVRAWRELISLAVPSRTLSALRGYVSDAVSHIGKK